MRLHAIALTIHILGLIALFGAFVIQHRVMARLRGAASLGEARPWAELLATTAPMIPSGALMLLLTGGYLGRDMWALAPAWLFAALAAVLCIGGAGFFLIGPFRRLRRMTRESDGAFPLGTFNATSRAGWILHAAANGAALGTIWLMTAKPGWAESIGVVAVPALIGALVGARLSRRPAGS